MVRGSRLFVLTTLALFAFAGNSLLCRMALKDGHVDPATFTTLRIVSGALVLSVMVLARGAARGMAGSWISGLALFVYAVAFSYSYVSLTAGTGAVLLFSAVQATMVSHGLVHGERPRPRAMTGMVVAFGGLVGLMLPGISAPPLAGALAMLSAGVAWGVYSLRGRGVDDPTGVTAGNFVRAAAFAVPLSLATLPGLHVDGAGAAYAIASGALTSAVGYVIWYAAVGGLSATSAAAVQLSVPAIAALGGILLLGEPPTLRFVLASTAILGGIALVTLKQQSAASAQPVSSLPPPGRR